MDNIRNDEWVVSVLLQIKKYADDNGMDSISEPLCAALTSYYREHGEDGSVERLDNNRVRMTWIQKNRGN